MDQKASNVLLNIPTEPPTNGHHLATLALPVVLRNLVI